MAIAFRVLYIYSLRMSGKGFQFVNNYIGVGTGGQGGHLLAPPDSQVGGHCPPPPEMYIFSFKNLIIKKSAM